MKSISIDVSTITDRDELHDLLAASLSLPAWYGRNLDALYDCLTAITEETRLIFIGWDAMQGKLGRYASGTRRALVAADRRNGRLTVQFL